MTFLPCIFCALDGTYELSATFIPSRRLWRSPYSPDEWLDVFRRIMRDHHASVYALQEQGNDSERILWRISDPTVQIDTALSVLLRDLEATAYGATDTLEAAYFLKTVQGPAGTLATYFSFPPELSSACEQYLVYFGQFLRDVGVDSTIELQHDAGRVLFAVTPKNKDDALEKIREALEVYLQLPSATFVSSENKENRFTIQRLESQIYHFKGQLMLAAATIEQQQETIRILKYGKFLEGRLLDSERSNQALEKPSGDEEKLFGGRFIIKKLEGKGWSVDLPQCIATCESFSAADRERELNGSGACLCFASRDFVGAKLGESRHRIIFHALNDNSRIARSLLFWQR